MKNPRNSESKSDNHISTGNNTVQISIITVCLNAEKTIEDTIKSVIAQKKTYSNLQYIIVDGKSTDKTLDIINKYREDIDVLVSEKDNGISDAFNKGIALADGDIIGIINADDQLYGDALLEIAQNYDRSVDVYLGDLLVSNPVVNTSRQELPNIKLTDIWYKLKSGICHPSTFIRKDAYERFGVYKLEYQYAMDTDLLLRYKKAGAVFKYIPACLAVFVQGGRTYDNEKLKAAEFNSILAGNGIGALKRFVYWRKRNLINMIKRFREAFR